MKIINLLYTKFLLSFSICLISSFSIFFIFSLIGNLGEGYFFKIILKISLLNSVQILTYVPTFVFLISVILLTIFLRSKNEIIIIKSYLNKKRLMIFFLPVILIFTIFEINKKDFLSFLEDNKQYLIDQSNLSKNKIHINNFRDFKEITILQNFDVNDMSKANYRLYKISNQKLNLAIYSNNLFLLNNILFIDNYTQYKNNEIQEFKNTKEIKLDYKDIALKKSIININNASYKVDFKFVNLIIFFVIFLNYIFLIFFDKRFVSSKQSLIYPIFISIIILLYSFIIFNNSLSFFKQEFEVLATIVVGMLFLKAYLNE